MLVLSRKKDECIVINNDITIVVVEIRGDKVRLGVEAPKEVPVHRKEVYDAIVRDDGSAVVQSAGDDAATVVRGPRRDGTPTEAADAGAEESDSALRTSRDPSACPSPGCGRPHEAGEH